MHLVPERNARRARPGRRAGSGRTDEFAAWIGPENGARRSPQRAMRHGGANGRVVLHLRSCYVSKAAILTVPVQLVPVENRSPA